jgi:hypothetical protein
MRPHPFTVARFLLLFVAGIPAVCLGQPARSFSEMASSARLHAGDRIVVKDSSGAETTGVFGGFKDDDLVVVAGNRRMEIRFDEREVLRVRKADGHAALWGAVIGAASAAAVTAWAAASYGENETGHFCTGCFVQWGALSIPAGAGIGFGVGFAIDRLRQTTAFDPQPWRRSVAAIPLVSRRGAGLLVTTSF